MLCLRYTLSAIMIQFNVILEILLLEDCCQVKVCDG